MSTFYLKSHELSKADLASFKGALEAFGAILEAKEYEYPNDDRVALIASTWPVWHEQIQITSSEERASNVEQLCRHFGFEFSKEPPPNSSPT